MKRVARTLAVLLGLGALTLAPLRAQEVDATVAVNVDQLPSSLQQEVAGFGEELSRYINTTRWTDLDWSGDKVKMNINVVFTEGSSEGDFSAKILVGSQRSVYKSDNLSPMIKVLDDGWLFHYVRNQPFQHDPTRYDDLTGLIDFYVYLAIGMDLDSYAEFGGSSMYDKAWTLAQRAQLLQGDAAKAWTTQATPGSWSRYGFVKELTDIRFQPIRRYIYDYHYNGLDLLAKDRASALDSINGYLSDLVRAIDKLVQPSTIVRVLNDAKNTEYAGLFIGYHDPVVWRKLLYIDPGHQSIYAAAQDK
jgi:hypothetical protein